MDARNGELCAYGGTEVRSMKAKFIPIRCLGLVLGIVLFMSTSAFAQGSIFGTVSNSDLSTPANGEMSFVGFLDNTDEEIRLESSIGAGYDAGNWFDEFQNYLTTAAGNPYNYKFYNIATGEGFILSDVIPNNSFQQVNIALGTIILPVTPLAIQATVVSSSSVVVSWSAVAGVTYHVYRRQAPSQGSFFRIDNPLGDLADPGIAINYFVDNTINGISSYDYIIIGEDTAGNLSPHSAIVTAISSIVEPPVLTTINPPTGSASGGTILTITGSGFDISGTNVIFDITSVPATVNSPFSLTVAAPPGLVGDSVDVLVSNAASALISNIFVSGYSYLANATPVLAAILPQSTTELVLLQFTNTALDSDGTFPILSTSPLPGTAAYADSGNGTGLFTWTPSYADSGTYAISFYAADALDPALVDSQVVTITVLDGGNQIPVLAPIADTTIAEATTLSLVITASDPDGEIPALSASGLPLNASFVDSLNGTGTFTFAPDFTQVGSYQITFKAIDAALAVDSTVVQVTVSNVNQLPVLAAIGPQTGTEGILISLPITATDADGLIPILSTSTLPGTAQFIDSLNGVGIFNWTPSFIDAGTYNVTFYATDAGFPTTIDSEVVVFTITDAGNQAPALTVPVAQLVVEGNTLNFVVTAIDPDGTTPTISALNLPLNATFSDSLNGSGYFSFTPDFIQSGLYTVSFVAFDGFLTDTQLVDITVTDIGNAPPVIDSIGNKLINEGDSLFITVTATDPDGLGAFPRLSVSTLMNSSDYSFVDNGDGTGLFSFRPDFFDAGVYLVNFFATDNGTPQQTAGALSVMTVADVNRPPVIDSIGPFGVVVNNLLQFTVTATDSTDPVTTNTLTLSTLGLPPNATFVDNGDNSSTLQFIPDTTQLGLHTITFLVVDQGVPQNSATMAVDINVVAGNIPPVLTFVGPQIILEGNTLTINLIANDPDGLPPSIDTSGAPFGSTFIDNGNGTAVFTYTPAFFGTTRLESVTFKASDGITVSKELVIIQVNDAGNQPPVFDSIPVPLVDEGTQLIQVITAADPDSTPVFMDIVQSTLPINASFTDNGNGQATFTFDPVFVQAGLYDISLIARDGPDGDSTTLADTVIMAVTVNEAGNQPPILTPVADQAIFETTTLNLTISAVDADSTIPVMTSSPLPANASYIDNLNGTGSFSFTPGLFQAGIYPISFYASDSLITDSIIVNILVTDVNQLPFVFTSGGRSLFEMDTVIYTVTTFDADSTIPIINAFIKHPDSQHVYTAGSDSLFSNMTFVDNLDGTGTLTFIPDYTQGGSGGNPNLYDIIFQVTDAVYTTVSQLSAVVTFQVTNKNSPPILSFPSGSGPFVSPEGGRVTFLISVADLDGVTLPTLTATNLPIRNATFTFDQAIGFGSFTFDPDFLQAGIYQVTFTATDDRGLSVSSIIDITITNAANQTPSFGNGLIDTLYVPVDQAFVINVNPTDPELDSMTLQAFPIIPGATWVDNGDGTGSYSFVADSAMIDSVISITFVVTDYPSLASDTLVTNSRVVAFLRGDVDANHKYTMNDLTHLNTYLWNGGPAPYIWEAGDVNKDGIISVGDIAYLINFMFRGGVAPQP